MAQTCKLNYEYRNRKNILIIVSRAYFQQGDPWAAFYIAGALKSGTVSDFNPADTR